LRIEFHRERRRNRFRDWQVAAANVGTINITGVDDASNPSSFGSSPEPLPAHAHRWRSGTNHKMPQTFDPVANCSLTIL